MAKKDVKEVEEQEVVTTDVAAEAPVVTETVEETKEEKAVAKAGKRSAKAIAEAEEKEAKEERKALTAEEEAAAADKPKQHANPTRPRLERQGKNFRKVAELVEKDKAYT